MFIPVIQRSGRFATEFSLTKSECLDLAAVAAALPGIWLAQEDQDNLGHRTVALLGPTDGDNAPVILIWREHGRLHLGLGLGDIYRPLGSRADLQDVADCIKRTLDGLEGTGHWLAAGLPSQGHAARLN